MPRGWEYWSCPERGPQQPQLTGSCFEQELGLSSFPFTGFFHQMCSQKLKQNKTSKPTNQPKPSTFLGKCLSQLQAHSSTHCCAPSALAPCQETSSRQVLSEADLVEMVNQSSQVCWCKNNSMEMQVLGWEWMKEWTGEVVKWLQCREREA